MNDQEILASKPDDAEFFAMLEGPKNKPIYLDDCMMINFVWVFDDYKATWEKCDIDSVSIDAIINIRSLADIAKITELEKERDEDNFVVVPRSLNRDMRIAYHESIERHEDCEEYLGCPDDQWTSMIEAYEALKEKGE
jgi:hypothetical protein